VYLVHNDRVDLTTGLDTFDRSLEPHRAMFDAAVPSVGRVELEQHRLDWAGTGWLVDEDLVVTNRHVADLFAEADGRGDFRFSLAAPGIPYEAAINFLNEQGRTAARAIEVKHIEYIAPADGPDMALLRLSRPVGSPIRLSRNPVSKGQPIAVIGYPADDYRNDAAAIEKYFGTVFDKKRFAPGYVKAAQSGRYAFQHDCTTLGGNSGSPVIDLDSGDAVGLHFAGSFKKSNFAVTAETISRMLKGARTFVSVPAAGVEEAPDGRHGPEFFEGRSGYDPDHLGSDSRVPLPDFASLVHEVVMPQGGTGAAGAVANYQHFSLVMHRERRVPLFTAVCIDGEQSRRIKRSNDKWYADLRYPEGVQLKREHYSHSDIDRGHMVRREDPNWGENAQLANDDTFHYTNAAPQHAKLNQGKAAWLGLENYILESARTEGFRVCVFTGPVLRETDMILETDAGAVQAPEEFWKVVVARDANGSSLIATAYLLGQGALLDVLEGVEFRYGQYGTYQVTVRAISQATGLDFGALAAADPMDVQEAPGLRVRRFLPTASAAIL
jgi:endonuclease G